MKTDFHDHVAQVVATRLDEPLLASGRLVRSELVRSQLVRSEGERVERCRKVLSKGPGHFCMGGKEAGKE